MSKEAEILNRLEPFVSGLGKSVLGELREALAAQPDLAKLRLIYFDHPLDTVPAEKQQAYVARWNGAIDAVAKLIPPQPAQPANELTDLADLIAGVRMVSRATAYEMMREALAEAQPEQEPVAQWQKRHPLQTDGRWEDTDEFDAKWWRDNSQEWEIRDFYPAPPQPAQPNLRLSDLFYEAGKTIAEHPLAQRQAEQAENRFVRELREYAQTNQGAYLFPMWDIDRALKYLTGYTAPQAKPQHDPNIDEPPTEDLYNALAEIRNIFPAPERGEYGEREFMEAVSYPLAVPAYVKVMVEKLRQKD